MYKIMMDVLCLGGYSEILPDDVENTELVVEDLVALILLDLFGMVAVDGVNVTYFPADSKQQSSCTLQVHAACSIEGTSALEASLETLEARLENAICCSLIELFNTVLMNRLVVRYEYNPTPELAALAY